jgi:hypothetical protein
VRIALVALVGCASPAAPSRGVTAAPPAPAIAVDAPSAIAVPDAPVVEDVVVDAAPPPLAVLRQLPGIAIVESVNEARHEHGGKPATIGHVAINFEVADRRAHAVSAERVEMLRAHCRESAWHDRTPLHITEYQLFDWTNPDPLATSKSRIALPTAPGRYQVAIGFASVTAYQACDRFGFALRLVVDGARVDLELPLDVIRFEPLRHKH